MAVIEQQDPWAIACGVNNATNTTLTATIRAKHLSPRRKGSKPRFLVAWRLIPHLLVSFGAHTVFCKSKNHHGIFFLSLSLSFSFAFSPWVTGFVPWSAGCCAGGGCAEDGWLPANWFTGCVPVPKLMGVCAGCCGKALLVSCTNPPFTSAGMLFTCPESTPSAAAADCLSCACRRLLMASFSALVRCNRSLMNCNPEVMRFKLRNLPENWGRSVAKVLAAVSSFCSVGPQQEETMPALAAGC